MTKLLTFLISCLKIPTATLQCTERVGGAYDHPSSQVHQGLDQPDSNAIMHYICNHVHPDVLLQCPITYVYWTVAPLVVIYQ